MLKKSNKNYYSKMWELTQQIFYKYDLIKFVKYNSNEEKELLQNIYLEKLYNLLLDIVNQAIFDNINDFSSDEIEFILNFQIDKILPDIIKLVYENIDVNKIKRKLKKKKDK